MDEKDKIKLTPAGKENLVAEFKRVASVVGATRFFWEEFVDRLEKGECPTLNLKQHYKEVKPILEIMKEVHNVLFPGQPFTDATDDLKNLYVQLIASVKASLDH